MTEEQQKLVDHPTEMFVTACPGAGKSTTLVGRVRRISKDLSARKGIAVLSFTNSAVETFKRKYSETGDDAILRFPSFIGTFDSFVRHFFIEPGGIPNVNKRPLFIDSWDNLNIKIRISGSGNSQVAPSLDKFNPESGKIDVSKIGRKADREVVEKNIAKFESVAAAARTRLKNKGYLSAADGRVIAKQKLGQTTFANAIANVLKERFVEIIVDEAQDCNPDDLFIIRWLRSIGLKVTIVSDPNQAIYEFRKGSPQELRNFATEYDKVNVHNFTKNFRSSQIICDFAATLRVDIAPDKADGVNANFGYPIQLLFYKKDVDADVGKKFVERVEALDPSVIEKIILSHRLKVALKASGNLVKEDDGESRISLVCKAVKLYGSPNSSPKNREAGLQIFERLILSMMGKIGDEEHLTDGIDQSEMSDRELRRKALDFITSVEPVCDNTTSAREEWLASFYKAVDQLGIKFGNGQSAKKYFPAKADSSCFNSLLSGSQIHCPAINIHEVKGKEFDAVCVVIPKNRAPENYTDLLISNWEGRVEDEAKRVIYVGATRAMKILAVALPITYKERVEKILQSNNVLFEAFEV